MDLIRGYMDWPADKPLPLTITKQISRFCLTDDMTYHDIVVCVVYYVEILQKKISPLYGISFVPSIKYEAFAWNKQREEKLAARSKSSEQIVESQRHEQYVEFNIRNIIKYQKKPYTLQPLTLKEDYDGHK